MKEKESSEQATLDFMQKIEALGAAVDFKRSIWVLILFSAFINLFMLTVPIYMLQIYDRVLSSQSIDTLIVLTILVCGLLAVMAILDISRSQILHRLSARFGLQASKKLMAAFLTLPRSPEQNKERNKALYDLESLKLFISSPIFSSLFDTPWAPFYFLILFLIHPVFAWVSLTAAVLLFLLAYLSDYLSKARQADGSKQLAQVRLLAQSAIQSPDVVIAMGMAETLSEKYQADSQSGLHLQIGSTDITSIVASSSRLIRLLAQVAILGFGAWLVIEQEITAGIMIAASLIMSRALAPFERLLGSWQGFASARQAFNRLADFLSDFDKQRIAFLPESTGTSWALNDVSVQFPGAQRPALDHISLSVKAGEAIGIVGHNSAGKTTLARLFTGALTPTQGHLSIDETNAKLISASHFGKKVGYLPQDIQLLEASVYDNISRFQPDNLEEVVKVATIAGIHDLILQLPDGYDTQLGRAGVQLSGGQTQLLALARAIYGKPSLVVLDEPNSNLDARAEKSLFAVLQYCKEIKAAIIVISHKPNIMAQLDYLHVLREGKIDFSGSPAEVHKVLLRKPASPPSQVNQT